MPPAFGNFLRTVVLDIENSAIIVFLAKGFIIPFLNTLEPWLPKEVFCLLKTPDFLIMPSLGLARLKWRLWTHHNGSC